MVKIGLAPIRQQAIIWINDGSAYWQIYAWFDHKEMIKTGLLHRHSNFNKHISFEMDYFLVIGLTDYIWKEATNQLTLDIDVYESDILHIVILSVLYIK